MQHDEHLDYYPAVLELQPALHLLLLLLSVLRCLPPQRGYSISDPATLGSIRGRFLL